MTSNNQQIRRESGTHLLLLPVWQGWIRRLSTWRSTHCSFYGRCCRDGWGSTGHGWTPRIPCRYALKVDVVVDDMVTEAAFECVRPLRTTGLLLGAHGVYGQRKVMGRASCLHRVGMEVVNGQNLFLARHFFCYLRE